MAKSELTTKKIFRDLFDNLSPASVREGSVIVDQVIDPLVLFSEPLYARVEELLQKTALPYDLTPNEVLDMVGERYFVPRREATTAETDVVIVVDRPRRVDVSKGAVFRTQSKVSYLAKKDVSFSAQSLIQREDGTFSTPNIRVEAEKEGGDQAVGSEEISIAGFAVPGLIKVYNPAPSTGGSVRESNADYYNRIRQAISSRAMDTPRGILFTATTEFAGEIGRITLVGAGDEKMTRDVQKVFYATREVPLDVRVDINRGE